MSKEDEQCKNKRQGSCAVWEGTALKLFKSVEESITNALDKGFTPELLASEVVTGISKNFGGRVIYIPKGYFYDRKQRNKEIYSDWKGCTPIGTIAKKYNITSTAIYGIIASFAKEEGLEKSKNRFIK